MTGRRLALILCPLLAALLFGCAARGPAATATAAPTPRPTATPTPTPTPIPLTEKDVLERARAAMAALSTFRFSLTHAKGATVLPGGFQIKKSVGTVVNPDRLELTADAVLSGAFLKIDVVVLGNDTYMTNPITRKWDRLAPESSPFSFFDPAGLIADILAQVTSASFPQPGGPVGDRYRLTGTIPARALTALVGTVDESRILEYDMLIDSRTFRMTSVELRGAIKPEEDEDVDRTIELSQFDEPAEIKAPI